MSKPQQARPTSKVPADQPNKLKIQSTVDNKTDLEESKATDGDSVNEGGSNPLQMSIGSNFL